MTGGEALILGPTGRNIAAGMSGGVAWVLDLERKRLNTELVDPVELDAGNLERVKELLARHVAETGSSVAEGLLRSSDGELCSRFTMIVPRDYGRVMRAKAEAEAAGFSESETTEKMMEAARG
jgi:glutamate synthase (NADPH/NADH) large chain